MGTQWKRVRKHPDEEARKALLVPGPVAVYAVDRDIPNCIAVNDVGYFVSAPLAKGSPEGTIRFISATGITTGGSLPAMLERYRLWYFPLPPFDGV